MIQKVSLYFILPMCLIAFFLSLLGVNHISLGNDYYNFMQGVGNTFNSWKLEIPNIPKINTLDVSSYDSSGLILQVLIKIANFFVRLVNIISSILNVIIGLINIVIQLLQFILSVIYQCKDFINKFRSDLRIAYV